MKSLLIRGLPELTLSRLKLRAKRHGRSLQKEVEQVLSDAAELIPADTQAATSPLDSLELVTTKRTASGWSREDIYGDGER
jgi:plasmid stability protein